MNGTTAPRSTTGTAEPTGPASGLINRIDWEPGSDLLRGTCHCGARRSFDDPVEMWNWLLSHPAGHSVSPPAGHRSEAPDA